MNEPRDLPQIMLTLRETGELLRLGVTSINKLIKSGELPSVLVGGSRRVRMADLVDYVNNLPTDLTDRPVAHRLAFVSGQVLVVRPDCELQGAAA